MLQELYDTAKVLKHCQTAQLESHKKYVDLYSCVLSRHSTKVIKPFDNTSQTVVTDNSM